MCIFESNKKEKNVWGRRILTSPLSTTSVVRTQVALAWNKMILTKRYFQKVCLLHDFFVPREFFNPLK